MARALARHAEPRRATHFGTQFGTQLGSQAVRDEIQAPKDTKMATTTLTDRLLRTTKPGPGRTELWDNIVPGFGVRISARSTSYFFSFRSPTARTAEVQTVRRRVGLGDHPLKSLTSARAEAVAIREQLDLGTDPFHVEVVEPDGPAGPAAPAAPARADRDPGRELVVERSERPDQNPPALPDLPRTVDSRAPPIDIPRSGPCCLRDLRTLHY